MHTRISEMLGTNKCEYQSQPLPKIKIDIDANPIIMQNFSVYLMIEKASKSIQKTLSDICDPVSKPQHIHEFKITSESLLRALALGYKSSEVLSFFKKNLRSRHGVPHDVSEMIMSYLGETQCPEVYLVSHRNQSFYLFALSYRQKKKREDIYDTVDLEFLEREIEQSDHDPRLYFVKKVRKHKHNSLAEFLFQKKIYVKAERKIVPNKNQQISHKDLKSKRPLNLCLDITINLKSFTQLREYQAAALNSVVSMENNQMIAKSGYIVLPCGAGKTLLAISILSKIKKETLIICSSDSGTEQFKREIQKWTQGFSRDQIIIHTSSSQYTYKNSKTGQIFISTYSCLKSKLVRGDVKMENQWIRSKPWGLIILDECQTLPAEENKEIMNYLMAHVKIGLTATPIRQDNQIKALTYMIGPQLYVGNWRTFVELGYLANPKCIQIRTKLTRNFAKRYEQNYGSKQRRELCYKINPNKVKALLYLLHYHQQLKDSILVFCDDIALIKFLGARLKRPILVGDTKIQERNVIFDLFREEKIRTLILSRIGDEAIDLPNANVAIQINIQHGSRKQMLQRLGRIMRQKEASSSTSYNAIFYTVITADTQENTYFFKRHECLINEGFIYDLRLFEYSQREDIEDISRLDPQIREIVQEKFKSIVGDEDRYWDLFIENKELNKL